MCGRFALATDKKILEMLFDLEIRAELPPRYNIAPAQEILAVRISPEDGQKEAAFLKWGLVPFFADDQTIGNRMINARAETVPHKPSFRNAFKKRRLLIPATGFFEWKKENGSKQPYYICRKDKKPFSLAGLWERWDKGERPLETCTILTTEPNSLVAPLHNRMPVIIPHEAYEDWLKQAGEKDLSRLLKPYPAEELAAYPVSPLVNNPAQDSKELIEPAE
ncbi:MAG: SOS response-associated peptidase [Bacillota bacterium]